MVGASANCEPVRNSVYMGGQWALEWRIRSHPKFSTKNRYLGIYTYGKNFKKVKKERKKEDTKEIDTKEI